MTPAYRFRLATPADDAALRALLRDVGMPGGMELASTREPDFFRAERIGNVASQTIVCEEDGARLVGFGVRAIRRAFVDGAARRVAYLSSLRALPRVRGGLLLARSYRFLRGLEAAVSADACMTTIVDDNTAARAVLTSARAGLPRYQELGALRSHVIALRRPRRVADATVSADTVGAPALAAALDRHNADWCFAPQWQPGDFGAGGEDGPALGDVRVLLAGGRVHASLGVWDVSAVKQTVVRRYAWPLAAYQRVSGIADRLGIGPALPRAGQPVRLLYACCAIAPPGEPDAFAAVLDAVLARASGRGHDLLVLGLPAGHPAEPVVAARSRMALRSSVYEVTWQDAPAPVRAARPWPEIATL